MPKVAAMNFCRFLPGIQVRLPMNSMPGGLCAKPAYTLVVSTS
jgi:hypothetical protein